MVFALVLPLTVSSCKCLVGEVKRTQVGFTSLTIKEQWWNARLYILQFSYYSEGGEIMLALAAATAATFDSTVMTQVVDLVTSALGVLTDFPCNLFLYGGLATIGFELFSKAKHSAM